MLRRDLASFISAIRLHHRKVLAFLSFTDMSHQGSGCTSPARCEFLRYRTNSPLTYILPRGGLGMTRSKQVSPVQVSVLPSPGVRKGLLSGLWPVHQSSTRFSPSHSGPLNSGFVGRVTSRCSIGTGGGSVSMTSSGEKKVVRGFLCTRTR